MAEGRVQIPALQALLCINQYIVDNLYLCNSSVLHEGVEWDNRGFTIDTVI